MFLHSKPFDPYSAPSRLGSQISHGGLPKLSTDTRFCSLQNCYGAPFQGFVNTPGVYQPHSVYIILSRTCFIFLVCGRRCLEIYTRVHARNTKSSREEVTLVPCAGYHWRHKHWDAPRTCFSSGLKTCYGQQGGCSLASGWLFLVLPSWRKKCYS